MKAGNLIPITFNPRKHHLGFLKQQINYWRLLPWTDAEQEIRRIGINLIDLYCGHLDTNTIFNEIFTLSANLNLTSAEKLAEWLGQYDYRKTILSDGSVWVIRQGQDPRRFLHIHPAKYSPLTIRVRASTLKTVIALKVSEDPGSQNELKLADVNCKRQYLLGLSPVKGLEKNRGISRIWNLFSLK